MTEYGVDYTGRIAGQDLRAAGKTFVCRYLALPGNPKIIQSDEANALLAAGIGIVLNWEQAGQAALNGQTQGMADARMALGQANAMGVPPTVPIYFSVDFDAQPVDFPAVRAYFKGINTVLPLGRIGVYGSVHVIEDILPLYASWGWQTYAWSAGQISQKAHLYQYQNGISIAGVDCDADRSLKTTFGEWTDMLPADFWNFQVENTETAQGVLWDLHGRVPGDLASRLDNLKAAVAALENEVAALHPATSTGLTADDLTAIANKVADVIEARLQS